MQGAAMKLVEKVTILPVITTLDMDADRVLNAALDSKMKGCIVIGENEDGELYFASSWADGDAALWWMEKAKLALLGVG